MTPEQRQTKREDERHLIARAIQARAQRRQREHTLREARAAVERFGEGSEGPPLPVRVTGHDNDLTRRQVLIYSILGQAVVQVTVQVLRVVL